MNTNQNHTLHERLNAGQEMALEETFRAYEPYLRMVIRRQISPRFRPKFDSVDVVQSVWLDLLTGMNERGRRFQDADHLRAFLVRLTRNRFVDFYRRNRAPLAREQPLGSFDEDEKRSRSDRPSEVVQANELWERILEICPPAHRRLLELKREGLPLAEIAKATGLHEGSIRRILADLSRRYSAGRLGARR